MSHLILNYLHGEYCWSYALPTRVKIDRVPNFWMNYGICGAEESVLSWLLCGTVGISGTGLFLEDIAYICEESERGLGQ